MQFDVGRSITKAIAALPNDASSYAHTEFRHRPSRHCQRCLTEVVENALAEINTRGKQEAEAVLAGEGIDERRIKAILSACGKGQRLGRPEKVAAKPLMVAVG